jgi:hypothetical protein
MNGVVNEGKNAPAGGEIDSIQFLAGAKNGPAGVILDRLTPQNKFAYRKKKIAYRIELLTNLLTISKFIVSKNLLTKFAYREKKLLTVYLDYCKDSNFLQNLLTVMLGVLYRCCC